MTAARVMAQRAICPIEMGEVSGEISLRDSSGVAMWKKGQPTSIRNSLMLQKSMTVADEIHLKK